jgi:hypothetical protein
MATDGITHTGDMTTDEIHTQKYWDAMTGDAIARAFVVAGRRLAIEHHGGLANGGGELVADHIQPPGWIQLRGVFLVCRLRRPGRIAGTTKKLATTSRFCPLQRVKRSYRSVKTARARYGLGRAIASMGCSQNCI